MTKILTTLTFTMMILLALGGEVLRVEITGTDITCFGQRNGRAELYIEGGVQPYRIQWNTGSTLSAIDRLQRGVYSVTVTDSRGDQVEDSVEIRMPGPISVNYGTPTVTSAANFNADLNITVRGGSPWELDEASTMYMFRLDDKSYYTHPEMLEDGVHKMTVEDSRGCKLSMKVNLRVGLDGEELCQGEEYNGLGNVEMRVHPIHLVIEQKKHSAQGYN